MTPTVFQGVLSICAVLAIMGLTFKVGAEQGADPIDLCLLVFFSALLGYLQGVFP